MYNNILTDLDSLFDTRLGIAFAISSQDTIRSIEDNSYYNRVYNSIGNIPPIVLEAFYNRRNKQILKYCKPTAIFNLLLDQFIDNRDDIRNNEVKEEIKIVVNTYPYLLSDSESVTLLGQLSRMFGTPNIELVNLSKDELTPDWIHQNQIQTAFLYSGLEWLDYQIAKTDIDKNPINNLLLVIPALARSKQEDVVLDKSFFLLLKEKMKIFADLIIIDVKYFSATDIRDPESLYNQRRAIKEKEKKL